MNIGLNSSKAEKIGVYAIKNEVLKNELLDDEIPVNDKTPSWDGEIFVYNDRNHKASNLYGTVPVQVKSRQVKKLNQDKIKYRLHKKHIQNYLHKGGVLYFVVEYLNSEQTKIYYDALLPLDLKKLIKALKDKQSTFHEFTALPEEKGAMDTICRQFILNSNKQKSLDVLNIEVTDINKGSFIIPSVDSKLSTIFNYPSYIYSKEKHYNLEIPLEKIQIFQVIEKDNLEIGVCGVIYYPDITRRIEKDRVILEFGKGFKMEFQRDSKLTDQNIDINFTETGGLKDRIKDSRFMLKISNARHIEIGGHLIQLNVDSDKVVKELPDRIKYLEELNQVFKLLNIPYDVPMDILEADDYRNIEHLRNIILYKDYSRIELKRSSFLNIIIADMDILLAVTKKNEEWCVFNAFESEKLFRIVASEEKDGPKFEISPYMLLKINKLFKKANFNLKEVEKSLLKIDYDMDSARSLVNNFLLDIINYYDDVNKNKEFLTVVENVYRHLMKFDVDDDGANLLNVMQITKRKRNFNDGELELIFEKKANQEEPFMICGYSALLGNKTEFDFYFSRLTKEEQKRFKTFPIYNLIADK